MARKKTCRAAKRVDEIDALRGSARFFPKISLIFGGEPEQLRPINKKPASSVYAPAAGCLASLRRAAAGYFSGTGERGLIFFSLAIKRARTLVSRSSFSRSRK